MSWDTESRGFRSASPTPKKQVSACRDAVRVHNKPLIGEPLRLVPSRKDVLAIGPPGQNPAYRPTRHHFHTDE